MVQVPENEVFTFYTITCLTAPTLGLLLSIIFFNWIGGYGSRGAIGLCLFISILCVLFSIPLPLSNQAGWVYCLVWFVYFFSSLILAPLIGIMLGTVPREGRATANSLATLCYNVCGYGLAPLMFGVVADKHDQTDSINSMRFAMGILMYCSIFTSILLFAATLIKLRRDIYDKDNLKKNANDDEGFNRIGKDALASQHPNRQPVIQLEDALSSHVGDSQVTSTNGNLQTNQSQVLCNLPLTNRSGFHMTNLTDNSDDSF